MSPWKLDRHADPRSKFGLVVAPAVDAVIFGVMSLVVEVSVVVGGSRIVVVL